MANDILKTMEIDGVALDVPQGGTGGGDYTLTKATLSPSIVLNEDGTPKSTVTDDILLPYAIGLPNITYTQTGVSGGGQAFWQSWLQYAVKNYKDRLIVQKQILAVAQPNSMSVVRGYVYPADSDNWGSHNNLPQYSMFSVENFGAGSASQHFEFGTSNYTFWYRATDSNTVISPATAAPLMDGTAAVGTSALYARQDHRHPTDTTRAPLASPAFTGTPTAPTNGTASTANTQIATTAFVQNAINRRLPKATTVFYNNETAVSVPNNTTTNYANLWKAPAAGTVVGQMRVRFVANSTGTRSLYGITGASNIVQASLIRVSAATNGVTELSVPFIYHIASGTGIGMQVLQNSGAALNIDRRQIGGIWIPD